MKKILFALVFASDLFADVHSSTFEVFSNDRCVHYQMQPLQENDPNKVFELVDFRNLTEQQIRSIYHSLDKDVERSDKINLQKYIRNELNMTSRPSKSRAEKQAERKIKKILSEKGIDIKSVRIIDAKSYINGLYLSRAEKNRFIKALTSDKEMERQVDIFCENHRFVDMSPQLLNNLFLGNSEIPDNLKDNPELKSSIRAHLLDDSKKSKVYREAMVSYLAKERAFDFASEYYLHPNRLKSKLIVEGEEGRFFCCNGTLCYSYINCYDRSFFKKNDSVDIKNGLSLFKLDKNSFLRSLFFHEAGHSKDFFSHPSFLVDMDKTALISPLIRGINVDLDVFDQGRSYLLEKYKRDPKLLEKDKDLLKVEETDPVKVLDLLRSRFADPVFVSNVTLSNSSEIWQILGVFYSDNTLYINKMSDFSLSCDLGLPIRCDHMSCHEEYIEKVINEYKKQDPLSDMIQYKLPTEIYDTLMGFNDTTMATYIQKLEGKVFHTSIFSRAKDSVSKLSERILNISRSAINSSLKIFRIHSVNLVNKILKVIHRISG